MGATTIGALAGAAIDGMSGDDGTADGAIIGAVVANVIKVAVPLVIAGTIGWLVLRSVNSAMDRIAGKGKSSKARSSRV